MVSVAFILLMNHAIPYFHGRLLLGVTVPGDVRCGSQGATIIRRYELQLLPWTLAGLLSAILLPLSWAPIWFCAAIAAPGIATIRAYAHAYRGARRFSTADTGIREAALIDPGDDVRRIARRFLPPLFIPCAAALYLRVRWDEIPVRFPVHWTMDGIPNGWSDRTAAGIYGPLLFAALIIVFLAGLCTSILLGSRRRTSATAVLSVTTAVAHLVAAVFSMVVILALHHVPMWAFLAVMIVYFIVLGRIIIRAMQSTSEPEETTPDECWIGGQIYYNPDDPVLYVQTRVGNAYALNLGNRASWFLVGLIVLYIAAMACLAQAIWS